MTNVQPDSAKPKKPPTPLMLKIGFGLSALSILWWFLYYAQYGGAFRYFDLKLACLNGATDECLFFQQQMAATSVLPTYLPIFWYAGLVAMVIGFYQNHQARKAAS